MTSFLMLLFLDCLFQCTGSALSADVSIPYKHHKRHHVELPPRLPEHKTIYAFDPAGWDKRPAVRLMGHSEISSVIDAGRERSVPNAFIFKPSEFRAHVAAETCRVDFKRLCVKSQSSLIYFFILSPLNGISVGFARQNLLSHRAILWQWLCNVPESIQRISELKWVVCLENLGPNLS